mgnify:CR=1 FL=1
MTAFEDNGIHRLLFGPQKVLDALLEGGERPLHDRIFYLRCAVVFLVLQLPRVIRADFQLGEVPQLVVCGFDGCVETHDGHAGSRERKYRMREIPRELEPATGFGL